MEQKNNKGFFSDNKKNINDIETQELLKKHLSSNNIKISIKKYYKTIIIIFISIMLIIILFLIIINIYINNSIKNQKITQKKEQKIIEDKKEVENVTKINYIYSEKWLVLTTINIPNYNIRQLLVIKEPWKIVVIGDIKTNNKSWDIFKNSKKLIFLSVEDQINLGYNITKYIPTNSYSRKNIGYLFAIQHGAKEIYETDDNCFKFRFSSLYKNEDKITYYAENNNNTIMINPYSFFGKSTMWPRGYRLKDLEKNSDTKFYRLVDHRTKVNHLIYQGLINIDPDVDSIYTQTRANKKVQKNQYFSFSGNLMYLPGNFIPINSKNTRYLYDVFPSLPLPTTISKRVSDIWRGYLMQRYAWIYNGTVVFQTASINHIKGHKNNNDTKDFIEEKDLFFKLDLVLNILKDDMNPKIKIPSNFIIDLVKLFVEEGILGENDLNMYKAFLDDLNSFGYQYNLKFGKTIERNHKKLLNTYSDLHFFFARHDKLLLLNNNKKALKVFQHKDPRIKYDDILLIINYNFVFLTKNNDYLLNLYQEYFPHMIFVYPGEINNNATYVSCPESHNGYYSYVCVKRVYELYPNKKGYLFLMDDDFLKVWELENFDFNIPWFYSFFKRYGKFYKKSYKVGKYILDIHLDWKKRYSKFLDSNTVAYAVSDIYYIPQNDIKTFCSMVDIMYKKKLFLETAVPLMMGIMLKERYQNIYFCGLWGDSRNNVIDYIRKANKQVTIHPIKFSNVTLRQEVTKYIFFINGREY